MSMSGGVRGGDREEPSYSITWLFVKVEAGEWQKLCKRCSEALWIRVAACERIGYEPSHEADSAPF